MAKEFTHNELCKIAAKWLQRSVSNSGHGCKIAVTEVGYSEIADAIGFLSYPHQRHPNVESVLVEAKTSRSDFLKDAAKPHRQPDATSLGDIRYYICPEGLIKPEELPPRWGLLYVTSRGSVKVIAGLAYDDGSTPDVNKWLNPNPDKVYERIIMCDVITRVNARSIESRHEGWRQTYRDNKKLKLKCNNMSKRYIKEIKRLKAELSSKNNTPK